MLLLEKVYGAQAIANDIILVTQYYNIMKKETYISVCVIEVCV